MRGFIPDPSVAVNNVLSTVAQHGGVDGRDNEHPVLPLDLCRRLSPELNWSWVSGFDEATTQLVIERALTHAFPGKSLAFSFSECILLTLTWLRTGHNATAIARHLGSSAQTVIRALHRGVQALAACFEEFKPYGGAPSLDELLPSEEKLDIPSRALASRFVVDGKHIRGKRLGTFESAPTYYSYKLNAVCYQFQCVVTHLGQCVHV